MNIETFFKENQSKFDIASPDSKHLNRFTQKLEKQEKKTVNYKRFLTAVAAVILVLFSLVYTLKQFGNTQDSIPTEFAESQQYFATIINKQLATLKTKTTPETSKLIDDTYLELKYLEVDYNNLMQEFKTAKNQQYIISMMIQNFQQRIALLEAVSKQLENLNNSNYEII
jgi:hypothetical protein